MSFHREIFLTALTGILKAADWYRFGGHTAVLQLAGTAAVESNFGTYRRQIGGGPALGVFQMEPATLVDIYNNYFPYRPHLCQTVQFLTGASSPDLTALEQNLTYQVLLARVHYLRVPSPLPLPEPRQLAWYWKRHWNTMAGAGTVAVFLEKWSRYMEA